MAKPATMAGKYNRSRQLSFGRGTVIVMINLPLPLPLRLSLSVLGWVLGDSATQLVEHCEKHLYNLFQYCLSHYHLVTGTAAPRDEKIEARCGLQSRTMRNLEKTGPVFLREFAVPLSDIQSNAVASAFQMIASRGSFR